MWLFFSSLFSFWPHPKSTTTSSTLKSTSIKNSPSLVSKLPAIASQSPPPTPTTKSSVTFTSLRPSMTKNKSTTYPTTKSLNLAHISSLVSKWTRFRVKILTTLPFRAYCRRNPKNCTLSVCQMKSSQTKDSLRYTLTLLGISSSSRRYLSTSLIWVKTLTWIFWWPK